MAKRLSGCGEPFLAPRFGMASDDQEVYEKPTGELRACSKAESNS
jgi:hypothetical protein